MDNDDLPAYYRGADVIAIPSRQEGLTTVGLEAMACGMPVVSTRCGGPEEYVKDGETGCFVDLGDVEALAGKLQGPLTSTEDPHKMEKRVREHVVETSSIWPIRSVGESVLDDLTV